jgi:hypothetical protein
MEKKHVVVEDKEYSSLNLVQLLSKTWPSSPNISFSHTPVPSPFWRGSAGV